MMMAKVDQFLDSLIHYDKENIHPNILTAIEVYLKDKEFDPDFIRSKSGAAAGLCSWVINVIKFYEVYCEVEPKRRALNDANAQLHDAQTRLENLNAQVVQLEKALSDLTRRYTVAVEAKVKCQQEADATGATISLANRLVGGLASEKVRWGTSVKQLKEQASMLPGDVLLVASFISYVGCFTKQYRVDLLEKKWIPHLAEMKVKIPMSLGM
jgi:dynein heavy chain